MGPFNWCATFSAVVLLTSLLGCGAPAKHEGTGEYFYYSSSPPR